MSSNFNTITTSTEHEFEIVIDGKQTKIKVRCSTRLGATPDIIKSVMRQLLYAARRLALGYTDEFADSEDGPPDVYPPEGMMHGESVVNVHTLGRGLPVLTEGGYTFVSLNVCNEMTTAGNIMNSVWEQIIAFGDMATVFTDINANAPIVSNGNGNGKPKPQQKQAPQTKETRDAKAAIERAQQTTKQRGQAIPEDVDIIDYDYKQKDMYNSRYRNRPVVVNVAKLRRVINAKKDGTGSYECIEVYGYHNGYTSKHPIYDLRMFSPNENQKWSNWEQAIHDTGDALLAAGGEIETPMQLIYKVNASKQEGDNRVFWNLREVRFLDDAPLDVSDAPDWGQDDIPWSDGDDPDNDPSRHLDM
jgi:hypothetical protein